MLLTFFLVTIGWIIFRAENIGQAWAYVCRICDASLFSMPFLYVGAKKTALFALLMLVVEWLQRDKQHALQMDGVRFFASPIVRYAVYLAIFVVIVHFTGEVQTFIYFQF